ncbi:MAG TPA: sodium:solute symporter family protein [Acetomicrobium sp.]|nr:sodium:solute symporter family protein [Acetomicrobium sp.]
MDVGYCLCAHNRHDIYKKLEQRRKERTMTASFLMFSIGIWFIVGTYISYTSRQKGKVDLEDYFLGSRRIDGFISAMTYSATTYSAFMMVGLVGLTYRYGVAALGFELIYLMGTVILLLLFAPRYWLAGKRHNLISPSELLSFRYENKGVGAINSMLCLVMLIPYASVQLMGAGYLVETLSDGSLSYTTGTVIAAIVTFVFCWWAGLRSVARTDAFQAVIMLIASFSLLGYLVFELKGVGFYRTLIRERSDLLSVNWPPSFFIGLTLPWAFFAITNPQVVQRLFIPKDRASMKKMILGFSYFGFIYTLICCVLGLMAALLIPGLDLPDNAMPMLLKQVPASISVVVFVSIMAAAVSTMNSIVLTLSNMFGRDLLKAFYPELSEEKELAFSKIVIVVLIAACLLFAQLRLDLIVVLSSLASGGLLVQLPSVWGAFFWRKATAKGAMASILFGGVTVGFLTLANYKFLGQWPAVWGLLVASASFILVSLKTKAPSTAKRFLDGLKEEMLAKF